MRPILSALAVLLLTLSAAAQDISWVRDGKVQKESATSTNSNDRQATIRTFLADNFSKILETDTLVPRGESDFGKDNTLTLPPARYEFAPGAVWTTHVQIDQSPLKPFGTTGFILVGGKYYFKNIYAIGKSSDPGEDAGIFCWNTACNSEVTFDGGVLDASQSADWGAFYNWSPTAGGMKSLIFKQVKGRASRIFLSDAYSGALTQAFLIDGCQIVLDANGCKSYGESSSMDPSTGGVLTTVLCRGGSGAIKNTSIKAIGLTEQYDKTGKYGCPRVVPIFTDRYASAAQKGGTVTIENVTVEYVPGVETVFKHVDVGYSTVVYQGAK